MNDKQSKPIDIINGTREEESIEERSASKLSRIVKRFYSSEFLEEESPSQFIASTIEWSEAGVGTYSPLGSAIYEFQRSIDEITWSTGSHVNFIIRTHLLSRSDAGRLNTVDEFYEFLGSECHEFFRVINTEPAKNNVYSMPFINNLFNEGMVAVFDGMLKKLASDKKIVKKYPGEKGSNLPLGKWAWSFSRSSGASLPAEKDTELEKQLYRNLFYHFQGTYNLSDNDANVLQSILKSGQYSDVIKEPTVEVVYRGFDVPLEWFISKMHLKDLRKVPGKGTIEKKFTFWPKDAGGVTSWTVSKPVAKQFASNMKPGDGYVSMILHARVDENKYKFVSGPGGLYKIEFSEEFTHEKEVLGLGPIRVFKIEYVLKSEYHNKK